MQQQYISTRKDVTIYIYQDLDECGIYNCIILLSMLTYNLENIELKLGQL